MNGIYAIIVFLCVQELTTASYYRIPKRYFKKQRQQETKQAKNAPAKIPTRNLPIILPVAEQTTQNLPEITANPEISINSDIITNPEITEELTDNIVLNDEVPILKTYQPLIRYELPKMTSLPILTLLPIVASLPVVNVVPKMPEMRVAPKAPERLPEVKIQEEKSYPVEYEFDDDDESEEEIEESVTMNILQEVKYEIVKREQKKSPILHKIHRIEEFKRNIILDRREDPRNERVSERDGRRSDKEGNMDLKEYLQRIAVRAELQRN